MLCGLPVALSAEVVHVATPELTAAAAQTTVAPSLKATVPARVPPPGATGATVTVKVTG